MGSLFSPPRPRIVVPPPLPLPAPAPPLEEDEVDPREETAREIARPRGLEATIVTSGRGLLEENASAPRRKQLLGE